MIQGRDEKTELNYSDGHACISAVCGKLRGEVAPAPNVDATVAVAVAATRTVGDVQEKVALTLSAPTPTTAPPTSTTESSS